MNRIAVTAATVATVVAVALTPAVGFADTKNSPSQPANSNSGAANQAAKDEAAREAKDEAAQEKAEAVAAAAAEQKAAEERAARIAEATAKLQAQLVEIRADRAAAQTRYDKAVAAATTAREAVNTHRGEVDSARELVGSYARAAYQSGPTDLTFIASMLDADSPQDLMRRADTVERVGDHKDAEYDAAQFVLAQAETVATAADAAVTTAKDTLEEVTARELAVNNQIANIAIEWANVLADSGQDDNAQQAKANADAAQGWAAWLNRPEAVGAPTVTVAHVRSGKRLPAGVTVRRSTPGVAYWSPPRTKNSSKRTAPVLLLPDRTAAMVTHAVSSLGAGYKWRTNTATFMDCSSLVDRAWNTPQGGKEEASADRDLVPGGVVGLARSMRVVSRGPVLPGDIVYYADGNHGVNHAGIAISGKKMIAADAATGAVNAISIDRDRVWKVGRLAATVGNAAVVPTAKKGKGWQCGTDPTKALTLPTAGMANMPAVCPAKPEVFAEANMQPAAILVARCAAAAWPQLTTIGGWRPSDPYPDHPSGQALDIMMPAGCSTDPSNLATGNAIAEYFMKNHEKFGVVYMIWQQRIWNATYEDPTPVSQWRGMSNRGSCTANHQDHVHVSVVGPVALG